VCPTLSLPPLSTRGRPRTHPLRTILDAILYIVRTRCAWRYLPSNFPPWQTVFYHFRRFSLKGIGHLLHSALHRAERERVGRNADPSAAIMDSQSVETAEESARIRGYDAHKCVKERKRHLLVDTLGLPIVSYVTPTDVHDTVGARKLLGGLACFVPRLRKIWADAAYRGQELADWCKTTSARSRRARRSLRSRRRAWCSVDSLVTSHRQRLHAAAECLGNVWGLPTMFQWDQEYSSSG
jgi:transposase